MLPFRPAVWQDQALQIFVSYRLNSQQVAHFALSPTGSGDHLCDAIDFGIVLRKLGENATEHMIFIKGEVMSDKKFAGEWAVIGADGSDVSSIEFPENVLGDELYG